MIDVTEKQLKIILEILNRHVPNCEVRAFGSRYKLTAGEYSDLDIAIVCDQKIDWELMGSIKGEFEESDLPFRVDVLDWNVLAPEFRALIAQGYEVIKKQAEPQGKLYLAKAGDEDEE